MKLLTMGAAASSVMVNKLLHNTMKTISTNQVAQIVGVSSATVRNWVKAGHLSSNTLLANGYHESDAYILKENIKNGSLNKLRARANKTQSAKWIVPLEYANHPKWVDVVIQIRDLVMASQLEISKAMLFATLKLLAINHEVSITFKHTRINIHACSNWRRDCVKHEIETWFEALNSTVWHNDYLTIYHLMNAYPVEDCLGFLYQCLSNDGDKSNKGAYYTPSSIISSVIADMPMTQAQTFLDPCCGSGKYLTLAAGTYNLKPNRLMGFDTDAIAVKIARINLLLHFQGENFTPQIECKNTLSEIATGELLCESNHLLANIDCIATNPPWGAFKRQLLNRNLENVQLSEAFSLFLAKSISLLKPKGTLSFILPTAFLNIKTHAAIRKLVLENTKINKIIMLGRAFTGVLTPVIRLDLVKDHAENNHTIEVVHETKQMIAQARFFKNKDYVFDIAIEQAHEPLLNKIYATPHTTLQNQASWALGIVTGDNKKHIKLTPADDLEAVLKGSDLQPFGLKQASHFIKFEPSQFQQTAKTELYRAPEKLLYKFISKKLVFSYDAKQTLTLNSANLLIPHLPNMPIKVVLAFLNSEVFQFIFSKKFATHKVLRGDLEQLPFPLLNSTKNIEKLVDKLLQPTGSEETSLLLSELQTIIYDCFNLSKAEIKLIKNTLDV